MGIVYITVFREILIRVSATIWKNARRKKFLRTQERVQKKVCVIDYRAECSNKDGIKVTCEFDKLKTDKNGSAIYDEGKKDFVKEHVVARI